MQPKQMAQELLPLLGGARNIDKLAHCTTRLRLVLHDEARADPSAIEKLEGVEGIYARGGQLQIILGIGNVTKVHRMLTDMIRTAAADAAAGATEGTTAGTTSNPASRPAPVPNPIIQLALLLSNIFVPIIPVIVASGLLNGLLGTLKAFNWVPEDNGFMVLLSMFSSSVFIFLPILVGFYAAQEFRGTPLLGAVIGGVLTHPALLNPYALGSKLPEAIDLLGFTIPLLGYQGTVVPIIVSVYLMSRLERGLRKIVPNSIELLLIPVLTIILTGFISLSVIGPAVQFIGHIVISGLESAMRYAGVFAGLLFGGTYSLIVITGLHHSFHAVEASLLADPDVGVNFLLPIWSAANVAQGGAGLAVFFRSRDSQLKRVAAPAALSAFFGIVEPIVFGINLKLVRPFIGALIGGALGGAYMVQAHVSASSFGLTGIPMLALAAPLGGSNILQYGIGLGIAAAVSFIGTWLLISRKAPNSCP